MYSKPQNSILLSLTNEITSLGNDANSSDSRVFIVPGKNLEIIGQSIDDDQTFHVIKETLAKMWQALKEFHDGDKPSTIREFL